LFIHLNLQKQNINSLPDAGTICTEAIPHGIDVF